jgi:hypothetical protein
MRARTFHGRFFSLALLASLIMASLGVARAQAEAAAKTVPAKTVPAKSGQSDSLSVGNGPVTFAWAAAGVPALVTVSLPVGVVPEEIDRVRPPEGAQVLGFAVESDSRTLVLQLAPADGAASFAEVGIELQLGVEVAHQVGPVRIVAADTAPGPLRFERSLAAPAAGLYLAVALRNTADTELLLTAIEYLPVEVRPADSGDRRLLFAVGDPAALLAALEQNLTPAERRAGAGAGGVPVSGFRWLAPAEPDVRLAPGEAAVLAWTGTSLPPDAEWRAYHLQPVIGYGPVASGTPARRLGLPVVLRAPR